MNKNELETVALDCLARLEEETRTARHGQDVKILRIEDRVNGFELQLTRLSVLYQRLGLLIENLNNTLSNGKQ